MDSNEKISFDEQIDGVIEKIRSCKGKKPKRKITAVTDCLVCGCSNYVYDSEFELENGSLYYIESFICEKCGARHNTLTRITKTH